MSDKKWSAADLPDLSGQTVIITGANGGLGLVTARQLAAHGAHVVMAVRDVQKAKAAQKTIEGSTEIRPLDLADLDSVHAFAQDWSDPIDILINNAGVMLTPLTRTKQGFELQFGTNHLGHFALTNLLLDHVTDRVVTVASTAHRFGAINFADPNWEHRPYSRMRAYGQSKLANLMFAHELSNRLLDAGSTVRSLAAHPGYASTGLTGHTGNILADAVLRVCDVVVAQSDKAGALPTLYAATEDLASDTYIGPDGIGELRGNPTLASRVRIARDDKQTRRLWELSEDLTGIR